MHQVNLDEAATQLPGLIQEVLQGGEVVIVQDDQPVARLVAAESRQAPRPFGSAKGQIALGDDFDEPLEDFTDYEQ